MLDTWGYPVKKFFMKGIDTLPPGPAVPDYDFSIVYYTKPFIGKYRDLILSRLMQGVPPTAAVQGLPVTPRKAKWMSYAMGFRRKDFKEEFKIIGSGEYDCYDIYEMYVTKNMSLEQIGKKVKVNRHAISKILTKMGMVDKKAHRKNNMTDAKYLQLKAASKISAASRRLTPKLRRCKRWRERYGKFYDAVYKDFKAGMPVDEICAKYKVSRESLNNRFAGAQRRYHIYMDWGWKYKFSVLVPKARILQYGRAAQKLGINVVDWATNVLNSAAQLNDDQDARS